MNEKYFPDPFMLGLTCELCWLMPESPLNSKEIKPINLKGNQLWIFIGRNDVEAEAPILWPPGVKSQFIQKDPDAWENWGREEKGATENKIAAWHHQLNGYEFEQTLGDREGQGSLACCSPWDHKEWDTTERLNNSNNILIVSSHGREQRGSKLSLTFLQGH